MPQDVPELPDIHTLQQLRAKLQDAIAIEFATIPPYLTGWWTIPKNEQSAYVCTSIQKIAIAEMRHLAIVANLLIAVGGQPDVRAAAPVYPCRIPNRDDPKKASDKLVRLLPFGEDFIRLGLFIEQPDPLPCEDIPLIEGEISVAVGLVDEVGEGHPMLAAGYPSLGRFYEALAQGLQWLVVNYGADYVFPNGGSRERQYIHFGGQEDISITDPKKAANLLEDIITEGEGSSWTIWDENGDLSHYFSFAEMWLKARYEYGDLPCLPSGDPVDWPSDVADIPADPKMEQYRGDRTAWSLAHTFNRLYGRMVDNLHIGFSGHPAQVDAAIGLMNQLEESARRVLDHTLTAGPGEGRQATPTFELPSGYPPLPGE
ncbi:ferritin-like protein [Streptomyces sp. NPDC046727]|uniref:ferritin-like domain-containing protein n=1 Tax=Streptomyces sp. NPDC046727 TaxID=3155373 RepID=UPI0033FC248D